MYYTKCQHNIKNINNTKLDKSIVYKYKFWQRQSLFGTSTFFEEIGLAASQSCRKNHVASVYVYATCTEWRNSTRFLSSAVLCLAALLLRTQVVDRRWMQCFCMFIRNDSCPESTCLVLGVRVSDLLTEWVLWLWALQWVFIIHCEWIWSLKQITSTFHGLNCQQNHLCLTSLCRPTYCWWQKQD